jgi:heme-degrading monooxygenase HmoA
MNARVVTARLKPDRIDEAVSQYRGIVVPAARQQRGYRGKLLFLSRDAQKAISITLWETERDMLAGETSGYLQAQFSGLESFFSEPPTAEHYEVSVSARWASPDSVSVP